MTEGRVRQRRLGWMHLTLMPRDTAAPETQSFSRRERMGTVSRMGEGQPNAEAGGCASSKRESGLGLGGGRSAAR